MEIVHYNLYLVAKKEEMLAKIKARRDKIKQEVREMANYTPTKTLKYP